MSSLQILSLLNIIMNMDQTVTSVNEEEENLHAYTYDGPRDYNDKAST